MDKQKLEHGAAAESLSQVALPDEWYIDEASDHRDDGSFVLPDHWWVVVSPLDGGVAAFASYEAAFGYVMIAAHGPGATTPL